MKRKKSANYVFNGNAAAAALLSALVAFALFLPVTATAQSTAARLDRITDAAELDYANAAYLAMAASGRLHADGDPDDALAALVDSGFTSPDDPGAALSLGEFSHMLMIAFDRPGGLLYRVFPGPRYAQRELAHERVLRNDGNPGDTLSGTRALRIIGRLLTITEAEGGAL